MSIIEQIDPEIREIIRNKPILDLTDIAEARVRYRAIMATRPDTVPVPDVTTEDVTAPSSDGHPPVSLRIFRPAGATGVLPCLYWIRGGGYVFPGDGDDVNDRMDDDWCTGVARAHACVVASADWRAAPEHPFPAALEDCYGGLRWVMRSAGILAIDPSRTVLGGASSGGGTAAGTALLVRDRGEFTVAHQLLIYPMLDDRNTTASSHQVSHERLWNRDTNALAWAAYLGEQYGTDEVSPYAAPARMEDLSGLAPATILTGELDLFRDENIAYAQRLLASGVSTELHVYRAVPHAFERYAPDSVVGRRFFADRDAVLRGVFRNSAAE